MHLLKAQAGGILDDSEPVDLDQPPADIVILSAADTEIAGLARAHAGLTGTPPSLRLASLLHLNHNFSVDLYIEKTLQQSRLVVLRLMGGVGYWRYGLDELVALARARGMLLAVMPGDHRPDAGLAGLSTLDQGKVDRLWAYLVEGGPANLTGFLHYCHHLLDGAPAPAPARPLPAAAPFEVETPPLPDNAPRAAIIFYRAQMQAGDTAPVTALADALAKRGIRPLPVHVSSLKDPMATEILDRLFEDQPPDIIINLTGFAISSPGGNWSGTVLDRPGAPVLQAVLAGVRRDLWAQSRRGLGARDIAMNVSLPEIDGRIFTRAISFKSERRFDAATLTGIVVHEPHDSRVAFVADLARNWIELHHTQPRERRIALILSNYPSSDGRIANGVGLDTPAGTVTLIKAMADAGYDCTGAPENSAGLMAHLTAGPTSQEVAGKTITETLPLAGYEAFFARLPETIRTAITERWGPPQDDPFFLAGQNAFAIPAHRFGRTVVAVQPARGFLIDVKAAHHDPDLPPPHGYVAFYGWLRQHFRAHAIIHMGKHGNLEWLPGKALALSEACAPEAMLGPLPHIYPFIANDPGEGTQAKRRAAAVIISHLTPPLTRAESYGPLKDLEALVDEYYQAAGVDPRRLKKLGQQILDLSRDLGLDRDCGIGQDDPQDARLEKLDNYLCDLKEMQIRDGLHVFGRSPRGRQRHELLVALTRIPRGRGKKGDASIIRALAEDMNLGFDPLDTALATPWGSPRPAELEQISNAPWRSHGDTVERLERLALALVEGKTAAPAAWTQTHAVLEQITTVVAPHVDACGSAEIAGTLAALDGRFVPPGPSGAPTRGRLDVLPTGRNFFSVDSRTVPTRAAWELGRHAAELLVTAHVQAHGDWPRHIGLSAWGTANMRTGGDDIAQAMALIGTRPVWDNASRRVTGFEIMPLSELGRPRIDILFRISGFFRDAFPMQIDLLDSAIAAVAALEEPAAQNPIAAHDSPRIFGSRPGTYGAGIQHLIDSGNWQDRADLAKAYIRAGAYSYGSTHEGRADGPAFADLLGRLDAVSHNQDAREFDLLDSDDFYEFEGGMAATAETISGTAPAIYHNDLSNPGRPVVRTLAAEIGRVVRGRAANPKWIAGQRRHGYKGAADMVQTVANLAAFAATTNAVENHHFEQLFERYMIDPDTRDFLASANPRALRDMARLFEEAATRGLWQPRRNSARDFLAALGKGEDTP